MSSFTTVLALIVMGLVVLVLIRGLFNMLKGTDANRSNQLMQLRLLLQAIAIALIMFTLWLTGGGRPS
jgi:heme/copper-type cytochrome/quinol oxidase subunit 2